LTSGYSLKKESIRWRGDPLDIPIMSVEFPVLVRYLVRLSKHLNRKFELPQDEFSPKKTWRQILEIRLPDDPKDIISLFSSNLSRFRKAYRFNLRPFANIRRGVFIFGFSFLIFCWIFGLSIPVYMNCIVIVSLIAIYYDGTNNWMP